MPHMEPEAIHSFDNVATAIDEQNVISETTIKPEMMKHFDKIKKDYGTNSQEKEVQLKDQSVLSPVRYTSENTRTQKKGLK